MYTERRIQYTERGLTPRYRKPRKPSEHIRLRSTLRPRRDRALPIPLIAEHAGKSRGDGTPPKEDTGIGLHGEVRAVLVARDGGPGGGGDEEVVHLPRGADCRGSGEGWCVSVGGGVSLTKGKQIDGSEGSGERDLVEQEKATEQDTGGRLCDGCLRYRSTHH